MPNGGSAGPNPRPPISFGSIDGSPAVANSVPNMQQSTLGTPLSNPPPARTPSPIPQPGGTSGGRPPQGLQGSMAFGSLPNTDGGDASVSYNTSLTPTSLLRDRNTDISHKSRPASLPQTGPANAQLPQPQHLRRDSSQSAHSDLSTANRNFTPNGRGRGYPQPYGSPAPGSQQLFRGHIMPQPRPPNAQSYPQQLPMRPQHANSPYPANRSPAMGLQQPHMNGPPMQPQGPYAYAQQYQPQVRSSFCLSSAALAPPSFVRLSHTELTCSQAQTIYGMPQQLDPNYSFYNPHFMHHGMPGMQYPGAPPSPRPFNAVQQPYMTGPYGVPPPQGMSRTSSQGQDRPNSTVGVSSAPGVSTAPPAPAPGPGRSSPAAQTSTIQRPTEPRKSKAIAIMRPDGTELTVDKSALTSPPSQPASRGPVIVSSSTGTPSVSTPTPPPPATAPAPAPAPPAPPAHVRTESQQVKSADERRQEFTEQFKKQLEAEKGEEKPKEDEEPTVSTTEEEEEAAPSEPKEEAAKDVEEKEPEEPVAEPQPAEEAPKADAKSADEEEMERIIAEMEAQAQEDEERERKYQEKKKKDAEEKARQEEEAKAKLDEELKRQEREAEELEEAREREREEGNVDDESAKLFASLKRPIFGPGASATPESGTSTPAAESPIPEPAVPAQLPQPKTTTLSSKPKPAALKLETTAPVEPAQPTAGMQSLKSARFLQIQNETVVYPDGIKSPNPALNQGKSRGRKYDKDFLLQFQEVFKEKPSIDWDKKIKDTLGDGTDSSRPQSARTPSMGGRQASRPAGMPGITGGAMGSFVTTGRTLPPGTTSDQRFHASIQQGGRGGPMPNPFAQFGGGRPGAPFPMGAPPMMVRTGSSQSIPQQALNSPRTASSRGKGSRRGGPGGPTAAQEAQLAKTMPLTAGQQLKPLEVSTSGWKPQSFAPMGAAPALPGTHMAPDMVQRKVKAALNKMTPEKFEKISGDILNIAMQSKDEQDGRTLRQVIQLTFEKACDEAHWASMYAKFCKRMLEEMSPEIKDENVRDKNNAPVVGGALFRKYLLNRCQEEFERGWEVNLPEKPEGSTEEAAMLSDEYYVAAAAKRRGLGLIQFIGELYKLNMLTIRIMHECVFRLLNFEGLPDESAIESLVKLLRTVGYTMEQAQNGPQMLNSYFERIQVIMAMNDLPSRLYYMLLDTVDLRKSGWKSKDDAKGPKTIQEIREDAAAQQAAAEAERARQNQRGGPRPPVGRGDARSFSSGGMMPPPDYPRNQVGMDDLKRLARGARPAGQGTGTSLGPTGLLGSRSSSGRKGGLGPMSRGAEDSGASSRTNTPPVKEKESTAHINAYRLVEHPNVVPPREVPQRKPSSELYVAPPVRRTNNGYSALAALDASGEGADEVASPPSAASSPPVAMSQPAIAAAVSDETSKPDAATS